MKTRYSIEPTNTGCTAGTGVPREVTFEEFVGQYATAPLERKTAALLAAVQELDGTMRPAPDEPLLSLKELATVLGWKSYTTLHRLEIQRAGESLGGRLRYRRSVAEAYLRSPDCMAIREKLRQQRRRRDGRAACKRDTVPTVNHR